MALNFSHRPIFPALQPDENIVQDRDIHELLPADPFGMDISSTVTTITGWLEDLGASDCHGGDSFNYGYGYGYDYQLFAGWDFWLNTAAASMKVDDGGIRFTCSMRRGCFDDNVGGCLQDDNKELKNSCVDFCGGFDKNIENVGGCNVDVDFGGRVDGYVRGEEKRELGGSGYNVDVDFGGCVDCHIHGDEIRELGDSVCNVDAAIGGCVDHIHGEENRESLGDSVYNVDVDFGGYDARCDDKVDYVQNVVVGGVDINDEDDGTPHPALSFALAYLGVQDLLSVERVCKSLCATVQTDTLLWRSVHIDQPLNDRITDDVLLELTNRAQGHLQSLSLVKCQWITDDGLKRVLDSNKELTKLSVPGCTRLSIDGVVNCLRSFKLGAITGIKYLRVGGLFAVTLKHFEELVSLLGIHDQVPANRHNPRFYHRGNIYLSCEDDRPIDIEMCPWCQNLRLVYDCPVEGCQGKDQATQLCRACTLCISRCVQCGKCINDGEYVETFCLEFICLDCWNQVSQCQERQDVEGSHSRHAIPQEPVISFNG